MKPAIRRFRVFLFITCSFVYSSAVAQQIGLTNPSILELKNVQAEVTTYRGTQALKLMEKEGDHPRGTFAAVKNLTFRNGTLDVDVAGTPAKGASETARGFIGVPFRLQADGSHYEQIYVRPTNGRADDQLRRNHSTQYVSAPDWPWERLRKESPGVYESYADMEPGQWMHLRIVVKGSNASLYVGDATQPCLLVHDLKLGEREGGVALWIGPGTEGYFRNLKITDEAGK